MRLVTCRYCENLFFPDYARVEWGGSICSLCIADDNVKLDACITEIEDTSRDITRFLTKDKLAGSLTGNPESRLRDVVKALKQLKKGDED